MASLVTHVKCKPPRRNAGVHPPFYRPPSLFLPPASTNAGWVCGERGAPLANSTELIGCKGLWVRECGSRREYLFVCTCVCVHGGRPEFSVFVFTPQFLSRTGVGKPEEELGGTPISGSATLAGGFHMNRGGEHSLNNSKIIIAALENETCWVKEVQNIHVTCIQNTKTSMKLFFQNFQNILSQWKRFK